MNVVIKGKELQLKTCDGIFSPDRADRGTLAMLSLVEFNYNDKVLDLGCGCGIVGILAGKLIGADRVVMCDIEELAVTISRENAVLNNVKNINILQSDGLKNITDTDFTLILSNPPYHTDFSVAKAFIEQGYKHLLAGGRIYMVTKRREWYENKLRSVFGGVQIKEIDGYYVFYAEKREHRGNTVKKKNENIMSKKLQRRMTLKLKG